MMRVCVVTVVWVMWGMACGMALAQELATADGWQRRTAADRGPAARRW